MKSYIWVTFAFLGWGYYELSGGGDFTPEARAMAAVDAEPEIEVVTRSESPTLLAVSTSNVQPVPSPAIVEEAVIVPASAPAASKTAPAVADPVVADPEPEVVPVAAPVIEPVLDLREVAGSRVNMRMGPGTDYDVITTLNGGTELEVLSVNADGWANVLTVDRGIEGWMAERLLTPAAQ